MGLFDHLYISVEKLPVSEKEKEYFKESNINWQTKSLDSGLSEVYITDDGQLKRNEWEYETIPEEEQKLLDPGPRGIYPSVRRTNERLEVINFHGFVNFYSYVDNIWYEFNAKFTDGKLIGIEGGGVIDEES